MNYYSFIPLVSFIFSIFITALILGKDMRKEAHKAFILFSISLQVWAAFDFIGWNLDDHYVKLALMRIQSVSWLMAGFLFLNFVYVFLGRRKDIVFKAVGIIMIAGIILTLPADLVIKDCKSTYWGVDIHPGVLFLPVVFIVVILPFLLAFYFIYKAFKKSRDFMIKRQLILLLTGTLTAIVVGIITDILMPYVFHVEFPGLSSTASVFQSMLIFVAVTRYNFLAIGVPEIAEELFHNMSDAVIIMNTSGKVVNFNPAAKVLLGDNIESNTFSSLIEGYHAKKTYDSYEAVLKVNGNMRTILLTQSSVKQLEAVVGWILIMKDISHKKQMETELIEKNRELDTFVYKASHDLKGPLSSIRGLVSLAREAAESRATLSFIDMIDKTIGRMDRVLLDLLQVTRIRKSDIQPRRIMLKKLVDEILESLQYTPGFSKVAIEVYCDEKAGLYSDINSVSSVLQNLVVNSINYRNPEAFAPWIDIMITASERGAEIVIADNGIGIPVDQQEKIFEMFYRASSNADGTGLGLYIVKSAVERLAGTVRLESEVGKGTKFFVFIPNARPQIKSPSVSAESNLSLTGAA